MPSCRPEVIPPILNKIMELKPKSILDVGMGCGKWGVLCDEYLRHWCGIQPQINGIDTFRPNPSPVYGIYRQVFWGDIRFFPINWDKYDLILMVDVIEHLEKEEGRTILARAKNYLIATPDYWQPQRAIGGNESEKHISKWAQKDFEYSELTYNKQHIIGWKHE